MAMAENKQTLYEILGVSPAATLVEIKAAHHAQTRALVSGETGLSKEDVNFRLQVLDMALNTLSAPWSRDAYDAEMAARTRATTRNLPVTSGSPPSDSGRFNAIALADAIHQSYRTDLQRTEVTSSLSIFAGSAATSVSVARKIFRAFGGLLALFFVFKAATAMFVATHQPDLYAKEKAKAEELVIIQDYYQKHGIRPATRAEAEKLEAQARQEQYEASRIEADRRRDEENARRFAESGRMEAQEISREREFAEARAREEEERKRQHEEWAKQQEEQKRQLEQERARREANERLRRDQEWLRQRSHDGQWRQPVEDDPYQDQRQY